MRQVICLSGEHWLGVPTRTQQLMSRMKNSEVLFFQPPSPESPGAWREEGKQLRPGVYVYTLPPTPSAPFNRGPILAYSQRKLLRFIRRQMERHHFREPVVWCSTPAGFQLLDAFPYQGLIYDCYRFWPEYPAQWESELALAADVAFAASPELVDHLSPCSANTVLLANGANYPMFARDDLPRPPALRDVQGPILGYMGSLWSDLDLEPVYHLARTRPDYTLVLAGADRGNPQLPALTRLPNVRWLDFVPPIELPDYLCNFDVCLYLLREEGQEDDVLQPRVFEYLSTGRPMVAMLRAGQVEHFPDVVYGAHSCSEFSTLCTRALHETGRWAFERRRAYGRAAAWSERAREVNRILDSIGLF